MDFDPCGICLDDPCSCFVKPSNTNDEFIAMKMLVRFKELKKEQPNKPRPDIGWMLDLLQTARYYERTM